MRPATSYLWSRFSDLWGVVALLLPRNVPAKKSSGVPLTVPGGSIPPEAVIVFNWIKAARGAVAGREWDGVAEFFTQVRELTGEARSGWGSVFAAARRAGGRVSRFGRSYRRQFSKLAWWLLGRLAEWLLDEVLRRLSNP